MTDDGGADRRAIVDVNLSRNKIGTSIVVAVLILLSVAAGVIGYLGWTIGDADVPTSGYVAGPVAGLVGIEGGIVSEVINLESSGVRAPDRRLRHDQQYHEDGSLPG
jgi:hypothetical protein